MNKLYNKPVAFRFRRFANKSYAAFCSMHKVVNIGCVSRHICDKELLKSGITVAVCCLWLGVVSLWAEDDIPDEGIDAMQLQIQEVSVVAQRSEFHSDIFRLVTTISNEEIVRLPVHTVADILQLAQGVDLRERGASGVQADLSIRGGTQDQIKVLVNGIDLTDPQTGHYSLDLPVDAALIDRIEVMQGTGYGLGAFSGAVNIITKTLPSSPKHAELTAALSVGEYGLLNPSLAMRFRCKDWFLNSSVSYNRSDGYAANTDYQIANAFLQTGWRDLNFQVGVQMKDAGANSFYSLTYPNQFDATRTLFSSVAYTHRWNKWYVEGNACYRTHYDEFELYRSGKDADGQMAPAWYTGANIHWTHSAGVHFAAGWNLRYGKTVLGVDARDEYIKSSNLGLHNRVNLRYFAEQYLFYGNLTANVGAAGIWNSTFGSDWTLGANIGYSFLKKGKVFFNVNRAIRIPTYTDLYYQSKVQLANPRLKPEQALQLEVGAKYSGEHWYANVSAYYRWGQNIIDWVKPAVDSVLQWNSVNHTRVNAAGTEVVVGVCGYDYLKKAEVAYSFTDVNKETGDWLSKYALDYLRHKLVLRVEHKIWKGFGASWTLRFQQRHGTYSDRMGVVCDYRPVCLLDGKVYWANESVQVAIECRNMTNQIYYDYGGILQPQHWVKMHVEWRL
ncbi:MAG TPA: hypothetical protein DIW30_02110 [Bacteroidales bacterium]|nr:hypothetical protein [Bacteroidales bacterium]